MGLNSNVFTKENLKKAKTLKKQRKSQRCLFESLSLVVRDSYGPPADKQTKQSRIYGSNKGNLYIGS